MDRQGIADVVQRYFMAIDRRDWTALRSCFTEDVEASYEGVRVAGGVDNLMAYLTGATQHQPAVEIIDLRSVMHTMVGHLAAVDGATAVAQTYAIVYLVDAPGGGRRLRSRGLRYLDELSLVQGHWRIRRREHILEWMREDEDLLAAADRITPLPLSHTALWRG